MLEDLLNCEFTETGVVLSSSMDVIETYTFMHEAIADDHLPVYKPIGFKISTFYKDSGLLPVTERNPCVLENWVEIAANLQDLVFTSPDSLRPTVSNLQHSLDLTPEDTMFRCNGKPAKLLYKDSHILSAIMPINLTLYLSAECGYWDMAHNASYMKDNSFFPMNCRHSIHDYVRICPPKPGVQFVEYRKDKQVTPDYIKGLFLKLYGMYHTKDLKGGDYKWLSNYEQ